MNLIEEYGSYESALDGLRVLESSSYEADQSYANKLKNKMLEYRRQHNIFEVGDKVVIRRTDGHPEIFTYESVSASGNMHFFESPFNYGHLDLCKVRHATDEEIKAGKRRPELDSDTCSDIRNHISPLTKLIDR